MLGYLTIGVNDIDQSVAFYDEALGPLGYARTFKEGGWAGYGPGGKSGDDVLMIYLATPHDKNKASIGNGSMLAFKAKDRAAVDAFYRTALKVGGKDEGAPGVRGDSKPEWYGAYVRDPVGNKICAFYKG